MPSGIRTRTSGIMIPAFVAPTTTPFEGIGDKVSGWYAWWGLRAYTAALRGPSNAVARIQDSAGSPAQADVGTDATTGALDTTNSIFSGTAPFSVIKLYDQTGNARHLDSDAGGGFPVYTANAIGSLPAMTFAGGNNNLETSTNQTFSQPFVVSVVVKRTAAFTSRQYVFTASAASNLLLGFENVADTGLLTTNGTGITVATATNNILHSIIGTYNGVASSELYVDGAGTTGDGGTNSPSAQPIGIGSVPFTQALQGIIAEAGVYTAGTLAAGQKTSIYTNQKNFYTGIP